MYLDVMFQTPDEVTNVLIARPAMHANTASAPQAGCSTRLAFTNTKQDRALTGRGAWFEVDHTTAIQPMRPRSHAGFSAGQALFFLRQPCVRTA
jgi:hypothetical protein